MPEPQQIKTRLQEQVKNLRKVIGTAEAEKKNPSHKREKKLKQDNENIT